MGYKQLRDCANRRNVHVRLVRYLKDRFNPLEEYDDEHFRLRFRLRKDSVSGLEKILDKDLQHPMPLPFWPTSCCRSLCFFTQFRQ